jgi:uncharacterized protein (DUF1499 family)
MTAGDETDPHFTDFSRLRLPSSPNCWLIAPAGITRATPDEPAPDLEVPAERLAEVWVAVIKTKPRTQIIAISANGLQIEAEQRSVVFGFVDRISFKAIPLDAAHSTFAAYSRAQTGYWDLGVNRRRLRAWGAELRARLPATSNP